MLRIANYKNRNASVLVFGLLLLSIPLVKALQGHQSDPMRQPLFLIGLALAAYAGAEWFAEKSGSKWPFWTARLFAIILLIIGLKIALTVS